MLINKELNSIFEVLIILNETWLSFMVTKFGYHSLVCLDSLRTESTYHSYRNNKLSKFLLEEPFKHIPFTIIDQKK